jgi:hypothetical protein
MDLPRPTQQNWRACDTKIDLKFYIDEGDVDSLVAIKVHAGIDIENFKKICQILVNVNLKVTAIEFDFANSAELCSFSRFYTENKSIFFSEIEDFVITFSSKSITYRRYLKVINTLTSLLKAPTEHFGGYEVADWIILWIKDPTDNLKNFLLQFQEEFLHSFYVFDRISDNVSLKYPCVYRSFKVWAKKLTTIQQVLEFATSLDSFGIEILDVVFVISDVTFELKLLIREMLKLIVKKPETGPFRNIELIGVEWGMLSQKDNYIEHSISENRFWRICASFDSRHEVFQYNGIKFRFSNTKKHIAGLKRWGKKEGYAFDLDRIIELGNFRLDFM